MVYRLILSRTIEEKINTTLVQDEHLRMAEDTEDVEHFEHPIEWDKEAIWEAYDVLVSEDKYLKPPGKYQVNDYKIMEVAGSNPASSSKKKRQKRFYLFASSFWVPRLSGVSPVSFKMPGGSEFRLRQGFAFGKTLVRRTCGGSLTLFCDYIAKIFFAL